MTKLSILICALLLVGCANAQDLCTLAASVLPAGITCTGKGAAATLAASLNIPSGLTYTGPLPTGIKYTSLAFSIAQTPCKPATAKATITDSAKFLITSGSESISITNGQNTFPIVPEFEFPTIGKVKISLVITLTGGIDDTAGLTFKAGISFCLGTTCDAALIPSALSAFFPALPLSLVPSFTMGSALFTKEQLTTLCPPPPVTTKASDSSMLHASMALAGVAIAAVVA
jgi:hypothetical protein